MTEIFVVIGSYGEYSDRNEWLVKAFLSEEKAKDLVLKASKRAKEVSYLHDNDSPIPANADEFDNNVSKYVKYNYSEFSYYYSSVVLDMDS